MPWPFHRAVTHNPATLSRLSPPVYVICARQLTSDQQSCVPGTAALPSFLPPQPAPRSWSEAQIWLRSICSPQCSLVTPTEAHIGLKLRQAGGTGSEHCRGTGHGMATHQEHTPPAGPCSSPVTYSSSHTSAGQVDKKPSRAALVGHDGKSDLNSVTTISCYRSDQTFCFDLNSQGGTERAQQ